MKVHIEVACRKRSGFTLIEILVSMAILLLVLLILVSITDATRRTWTYTSGKIEEFRDAREAFESITRNLSQATLNTYWDYQYPNNDTTLPPSKYVRQSELRFISGAAATLTGTSTAVTHAVFFQAPLGSVSDTSSYADLNYLLNTWGYFIEFGSDGPYRPPFINAMSNPPPERYRFRLMELMEPSESLTLYNEEVAAGGNANYNSKTWFTNPLNASPRPVRVLAENIVALIILPRLAHGEKNANGNLYNPFDLAKDYTYDSTSTNSDPCLNPKNQIPPVVQLTLVAVDEASFNRLQLQQGDNGKAMPDLCSGLFIDASHYDDDMAQMQKNLQTKKVNYRVFTINVSIKASKWSRAQVQ